MTIDPKDVRRGLAQDKPACDHPDDKVRDLPSGSVCKKCDQPVPPVADKRDEGETKAVQGVPASGHEPFPPADKVTSTLQEAQKRQFRPPGIAPVMDRMGRIRYQD